MECVVCRCKTTNKCSVCESASYCGKDCQRKDWQMHKRDCYNTANECNRVVRYMINAPRDYFNKADVHLITLSSLSELKDAQNGKYARHVCSSKVPEEWKTVHPLSMVKTSNKHYVIMLNVKCSASTDKRYYFAFALGKRPEDDVMTMVFCQESGMAFYQIDKK